MKKIPRKQFYIKDIERMIVKIYKYNLVEMTEKQIDKYIFSVNEILGEGSFGKVSSSLNTLI